MDRYFKKSTLFLAVLTLLFMGSTFYYAQKAESYGQYIDYASQRAMSDLVSELSQMDSALAKLRYASTPRSFQTIAANLWQSAETAKNAMSTLALEPGALDSTQKFVAQTGDFAYYLLFSAAGGDGVSDDHLAAVDSLYDASENITREISSIKGQLNARQLSYGSITEGPDYDSGVALSDGLSDVEQEFPEYATLIYDGPFSEHLAYQSPKLLHGLPEVTLEQAMKNAASFAGIPVMDLSLLYEEGGKIPAYCLVSGSGVTMEVSKQGGIIFSYRDPRSAGTALLDNDQAVACARDFLAKKGFTNMKESYYTLYDGTMTINFAYTENGITVYGDLIKVTVALDDGSVLGMEARGYLMSHTDRTLPRPAVSEEEGLQILSPRLTVESQNLALIPTSGENEVLCREYVCRDPSGSHILVYINAQTGQEENIYLLIEDENGVLTI